MRELRQASRSSMFGPLSSDETAMGNFGSAIAYRIPIDADGNGVAVDGEFKRELSTLRVIKRDVEDEFCGADANGDGITSGQLVMVPLDDTGAPITEQVKVLVGNSLSDGGEVDENKDGIVDPDEDTNGNGVLDRGIWFRRVGIPQQQVEVSIQTRGYSRQGNLLTSTLTQAVLPRNG